MLPKITRNVSLHNVNARTRVSDDWQLDMLPRDKKYNVNMTYFYKAQVPGRAGGAPPLFVAAQRGKADAARALIELGADANGARAQDGTTALMAAAYFNRTEVVRILLEAEGTNLTATAGGYTAYLRAAQSGHVEAMPLLYFDGADEFSDKFGADVYFVAVVSRRANVLDYLIHRDHDVLNKIPWDKHFRRYL